MPSTSTFFDSSTTMISCLDAAATIFSLSRAPPSPFMSCISGSTSSAPSMVTSRWPTSFMDTVSIPYSRARPSVPLDVATQVRLYPFSRTSRPTLLMAW